VTCPWAIRLPAKRATTPVPHANVENGFSCLGLRSTDEILCPFCCNRWYQVSLVKLWRATVELPMVVIYHCETLLGSCLSSSSISNRKFPQWVQRIILTVR
jgi:hypothetical protein